MTDHTHVDRLVETITRIVRMESSILPTSSYQYSPKGFRGTSPNFRWNRSGYEKVDIQSTKT